MCDEFCCISVRGILQNAVLESMKWLCYYSYYSIRNRIAGEKLHKRVDETVHIGQSYGKEE